MYECAHPLSSFPCTCTDAISRTHARMHTHARTMMCTCTRLCDICGAVHVVCGCSKGNLKTLEWERPPPKPHSLTPTGGKPSERFGQGMVSGKQPPWQPRVATPPASSRSLALSLSLPPPFLSSRSFLVTKEHNALHMAFRCTCHAHALHMALRGTWSALGVAADVLGCVH